MNPGKGNLEQTLIAVWNVFGARFVVQARTVRSTVFKWKTVQ